MNRLRNTGYNATIFAQIQDKIAEIYKYSDEYIAFEHGLTDSQEEMVTRNLSVPIGAAVYNLTQLKRPLKC